LKRHPPFKVHLIPTSSRWLDLLERSFGNLTGKAVRRGSFASAADLVVAIGAFIATSNRDPKPFIWQAPSGGYPRQDQALPAAPGGNPARLPGALCTEEGRVKCVQLF